MRTATGVKTTLLMRDEHLRLASTVYIWIMTQPTTLQATCHSPEALRLRAEVLCTIQGKQCSIGVTPNLLVQSLVSKICHDRLHLPAEVSVCIISHLQCLFQFQQYKYSPCAIGRSALATALNPMGGEILVISLSSAYFLVAVPTCKPFHFSTKPRLQIPKSLRLPSISLTPPASASRNFHCISQTYRTVPNRKYERRNCM